MSYMAIARKWRPTTFEEIAGQGHVTQTLQNAIALDRIHHAFLFAGPRGVGKTTTARALARALNCERGPTPDPCGECASCLEIATGRSPDVIEIDGASNNSVEDVRDLRESVRYLPVRGRKKVYIIDEVHMLSKGAFNALLKTLEEPPEHVLFLFATTEPHKIPETILSRVQRFEFKRIPMSVVVAQLRKICDAESIQISESGLRMVARAGEGSMRDSQSLLDQVISYGGKDISTQQVATALGLVDRGLLYAMLEGLIRGDADRCLEAIEAVYGYGYDLSEFTSEMLEMLRNATLVGLSPSSQKFLDVPEDERDQLVEMSKGVAPDVFVRSFQVMLDVHDQVARAPRPRLVLEMAVARLVSIRPAQPIDRLVDRLVTMERRLRQGGVGTRRPRQGRGPSGGGGRGDDDGEPSPGGGLYRLPPPRVRQGIPLQRGAFVVDTAAIAAAAAVAVAVPLEDEEDEEDWRSTLAEAPPLRDEDGYAYEDGGYGQEEWSEEAAAWPDEIPEEAAPDQAVPIDEDDEEQIADVPPPLLGSPTDQERFAALRRWLKLGGVGFDLWADKSALLRVAPPLLRVVFPSPFVTAQAQRQQDHPRIRLGIEAYFPGCVRAEVAQRPQKEGFESWEEREAEARAQRRAALRRRLEQEPAFLHLLEALDGTLSAVSLDDDPDEESKQK